MNRMTLALGLLALAADACSSAGGEAQTGSGGSGGSGVAGQMPAAGGASVGGGGTGGSGGTGAAGSGSTTHIVPDAGVTDATGGGTMLEPDAACGIGSAEATLRPVNMLIMFDRSTSMVRSDPDPVTKLNRWQAATSALDAFITDPGAAGLGVALRFFPDDHPAVGCTQEGCDVAACSEPLVDSGTLTVDTAPADVQEAALLDAIEASTPMLPEAGMMATGGTPISAALEGALDWASNYQGEHPDGHTVVLLVTDGAPSGCDERSAYISMLAENALDASDVTTYAVGLMDSQGEGLHQEDMDSIAASGGTDHAFFVKDGPTAADELLAALQSIRGQAVPCDFPLPEATSAGTKIDPNVVNVTYTPGHGDEAQLTKARDAADCESSESWHYDDERAPSRIILCPAACTTATADPKAKFEILVGCAPVLKEPR